MTVFRFSLFAVVALFAFAGCAEDADAQCQGGQCSMPVPGSDYGTHSVLVRERFESSTTILRGRGPVRRVLGVRPVRRAWQARPRILGRVFGRGCG